ncbi:Uncharacterized protein OS=Microcoleus sp. PCC 7113 GN=Mic7113_2138 PE=4 SV=1 [Gemmata massiliana]|uniref:DUF4058 domain-containing protein n=1 Tax=Gemmata massiliana TaxID=1210884 RepID=A0A6P2D941_9BACT|nr:DUF4058 domain-containing protein [Gemmata massiliana]VTR97377.1 Uncharacterized protein OS=Microcoleus sp. PCC 7113 GN=Mic7113_2138 PE=4 SV=1 [Gemmata massiliana]
MPLRDHFHPPLSYELEWHSFHNGWAMVLAANLNTHLPDGFRAAPNVQPGIEIDVATYGGSHSHAPAEPALGSWQPSAATVTLPFELAGESTEVLVHGHRDGRYLAGAIELVSEGNKDRKESREAFVSKCETLLQRGVGVVIVDLVTTRTANLHDALMARLGNPDAARSGERLYVTSYSPRGKNGSARLSVWCEPLVLGSPLPKMPLWLLYGPCVPVELETTYEDTFRQLRLPTGP